MQDRFSSIEQFKTLYERFPLVANSTKGVLLSTFLKLLLSDPSNSALQREVIAVFTKCSHQIDPDLQQRSAEYLVREGWQGLETATADRAATNCMYEAPCCASHARSFKMHITHEVWSDFGVLPCRCPCFTQNLPMVDCPMHDMQVLAQNPGQSVQHYVLPMPKWPVRESALLKRLAVSLQSSPGTLPQSTCAASLCGEGAL